MVRLFGAMRERRWKRFVEMVKQYNASVEGGNRQKRWDPAVKDDLATRGWLLPS